MSFVWGITLAFIGFCSYVSAGQQCSCIVYKTCIARNGTTSLNSTEESSNQCGGEDVMCCFTSFEEAPVSENLQGTLHGPRFAPGGGCGRKRPSAQRLKRETPSFRNPFHGEIPWVVAILTEDLSLRCSGSLISPNVVLTSAHCVSLETNTSKLFVRAGEHSSSQIRKVHKVIFHSGFDEKNVTHDIAIMKLDQPMELNVIVDVICTPEEGEEVITTECVLSGFGPNPKNESNPGVKKIINYTYESQEYCYKEMKTAPSIYNDSNICGVSKEQHNAIQGDGGGPLFCPSQADPNRMVQIGITSWHFSLGKKIVIAFTSVKHYLPWLRENLKLLSLDKP